VATTVATAVAAMVAAMVAAATTTTTTTKKEIERGRRKKMNSATNLPPDFLVITDGFFVGNYRQIYRRIFSSIITDKFIGGLFRR